MSFHRRLQMTPKKKSSAQESPSTDWSIPGVKNIFKSDSSSILRTAWTLALILCATVAVYQIADAVRRYFRYPAVINVDIVRQMNLTLPSITFCPGEFVTYLYPAKNSSKPWPPTEQWLSEQQQFHLRNYKITAQIEYSDSIHSVTMNDTEISTFLGICRLLSYDRPIRYKGSTTFSIFLKKNLIPQKVPNLTTAFASFLPSLGNDYENSLLYMLEDKTSYPLHHVFMYSRGPLKKGKKHLFQMTATEFKSRSFPNKPCEDDIDSYTQCWDNFANKQIIQITNCRLPFVSGENFNLNICNDSESLFEDYKNVTKVYDSAWDSNSHNCLEICDDTHYHLNKLQEFNLISPSDVEFHIDLSENIREIVTKDFGYTIPQMLSDIGGSLGLFLGCSVLTFLEILQTIGFQLRRVKPRNPHGNVIALPMK